MARTTTRKRALRATTVAVLAASAVLNGGSSWAASTVHQFGGVPQSAVALPAQVEGFSPYLPQVSCDPQPKAGVVAFEQLMLTTYKAGWSGGIVRNCSAPGVAGGRSEHKEGRAWDWMLNANSYRDQAAGAAAVSWLLRDDAINARRLGVMYLIWNRRIWSAHDNAQGWRPYNYGDPHTSHIHVSFSWAGAEKRTSWWTGVVAPVEYGPCQEFVGQPTQPYGDEVNTKPCPKPGRSKDHGSVEFGTSMSSEDIPDPDGPNNAGPGDDDAANPSGSVTAPTPGAKVPNDASVSRPGKERCHTACTCC
jgi:hypothetical protein